MDHAWTLRATSAFGLAMMMGVAWLCAEEWRRPNWRVVAWGLGLQFALGALILKTAFGGWFFGGVKAAFDAVTGASNAGAEFVFGNLTKVFILEKVMTPGPGGLQPQSMFPIAPVIAFQVLPVIIFVSALSAVLTHLGIIQVLVRAMAWLMQRTLKTSGAETFVAALEVFMGIESATAVKGYMATMTRSEIFVGMVAFLGSIAASVMVAYASFGAEPGHLLAASLMSAPASILIAKLMVPETGKPATAGTVNIQIDVPSHNIFDAAAQGASTGLNMALHVGATLIVFVALIHLGDQVTTYITGRSLVSILSYGFYPFAWAIGVSPQDVPKIAGLLATKSIFNEFIAYQNIKPLIEAHAITPRSITVATYALCGFANPGSLGIMIGGLAGLAPERRGELASLTLRAYIGGTLTTFMTACVAGVLT